MGQAKVDGVGDERVHRAAGVLLGQACGDALGVPYEFLPRLSADAVPTMSGGELGGGESSTPWPVVRFGVDHPRLAAAASLAAELHASQARKGTAIPYLSHLFAVCALVIEDGGDTDEAMAALLHDAVEDQGGAETLERIRVRFGDEVARIVEACSDAAPAPDEPKAPWQERKEAHLQRLEDVDEAVLRVTAADKLHNACATLVDLQLDGPQVWERFRTGREGFLWYHRAVLDLLERRLPDSRSTRQLGEVAERLEAVA